ncbi:MAG: undecaprenyl-diphosphate phosphatase [Immundisolibacter sp.]|uniref:undecaprenyl-diphosphate phosphatase n=1 Tax=Immundisolibacter sp. TaxID=1934948 RepID=UPI0035650084
MSEPTLLQIIVLAVVQGVTEFLPISSSAHLILVPKLFAWPDQGLAFDGAMHVGTLSAVLWYFRKHLWPLTRDFGASLRGQGLTPTGRLAWAVLLGTVPAAIAGLALHDLIEGPLRSPRVIAVTTIGYALLLLVADRIGRQQRDEYTFRWRDAAFIAAAQALALIPGTSRSGVTMTAGLLAGLTRAGAARFSFLLSIPITALAGGYEILKLIQAGAPAQLDKALLAAAVAAVSGYLAIAFLMRLLQSRGMTPFVVYRLLLGAILVAYFY